MLSPVQTAQAVVGYHLYSWGSTGQLGRPHGANHPDDAEHNEPGRVDGNTRWISSATSAPGIGALRGSLAVRADGALFVFTPTSMERVGDRYDWVQVSARLNERIVLSRAGNIYHFAFDAPTPTLVPGSQAEGPWIDVLAGNYSVYAINEQGQLWSIATDSSPSAGAISSLGRGDISPSEATTFGRVTVPPNDPDCNLVWTSMRSGYNHVIAVTSNGMLWSWGDNMFSKLGRPVTPVGGTVAGTTIPIVAANEPGRVGRSATCAGFNTNWISTGTTTLGSAALNSAGHVYTWGDSANGQLGRPTTAPHPGFGTPGRVVPALMPDGSPAGLFVSLHGGNSHYLAFTADGNLFAWGNNANGQLGLGTTGGSFSSPQHVLHAYRFSDAARGGGFASLMLMDLDPIEANFNLTKHLQKPEGTPAPNLNFRFTFERNSFNDNTTPADIARIPVINPIILNPTTVVSPPPPPAGTITLEAYFDFLDGIIFESPGTYSWIIREDATHPAGQGPDSEVVFSQAEYELRVYVGQEAGIGGDLYIRFITLHRLTDPVTGYDLVPPQKVNNLIFVNTYTYDPFITPTGLWLTGSSLYLVIFATGATLTAYLSFRARKRIEELPIMH